MHAWKTVCDSHLLPYLMQNKRHNRRILPLLLLLSCAVLMIVSLAGPTWSRLPVPAYQQIQPRVLVLDLSKDMLIRDLTPDRLSRAKFKLHDLLQKHDAGQFGLIVYTGEPFVVSPLTDDGQTIDELLSSLTPDIMPVDGNRLDSALLEAEKLIKQTGVNYGQVLVFTANKPTNLAINTAAKLAKHGIEVSIMPVVADMLSNRQFDALAKAGHGILLPFTDQIKDLDEWLATSNKHQHYTMQSQNDIPVWRDQGRWFLIPALCLMLPMFRRGWLQRINT